jgi:hypothetical protein
MAVGIPTRKCGTWTSLRALGLPQVEVPVLGVLVSWGSTTGDHRDGRGGRYPRLRGSSFIGPIHSSIRSMSWWSW